MSKREYLSLSAAASLLRVPTSGAVPAHSALLYHINTTGRLRPDVTGQTIGKHRYYGFTRATIRSFARVVGWQYVGRS